MESNKFIFRKVQKKDISSILRLFKKTFRKKINKEFYNWRYLKDTYNSFIALNRNKIVGHIGFVKYKLSNFDKYIYSRHSTFVIPNFQKKGVYYNLLKYSISKLRQKTKYIIAWPNSKNLNASKKHKNFKIIKIYHLFYKSNFSNIRNYKKLFIKIDNIYFKNIIFDQDNHLFFRNIKFMTWRYGTYKENNYFCLKNKKYKNFIFQKKNIRGKICFLIIDYYGRNINYSKEINLLINFLIQKKVNFQLFMPSKNKKFNYISKKYKLMKINHDFIIGLYTFGKETKIKNRIEKKIKHDIKISDTDVFIETN